MASIETTGEREHLRGGSDVDPVVIPNIIDGQVFYGTRKRDDMEVLVKQTRVRDMSSLTAIRKVIATWLPLNHPNVWRYIGTNVVNGDQLQLVQEWTETCTLQATLNAFGPMQERIIRRYLSQAVSGLEYLHQHRIPHG